MDTSTSERKKGLLTGESEAEVDTYDYRVEDVPDGRIEASEALKAFLAVEIRNEDEGGDRPATLGSAKGSWMQAPDDVRADWCRCSRSLLAAVGKELDVLIDRYGPDVPLATLID